MKKEELFQVFGELEDDIVREAETPKKRKPGWRLWGTMAACLCLAAGVLAAGYLPGLSHEPVEGGGVPGGAWPEGVDPIAASVAVYPAGEDVRSVDSAVCETLDEASARAVEGLGEYLPSRLPDGIFFHYASLYKTVMKDGTTYRMLRAYYTAGELLPSGVVDGETGELLPDKLEDEFAVSVLDYPPNTKKTVLQPEDLPDFLAGDWDGGTFHTVCGEVWIGFTPSSPQLSPEEILSILTSMEG